LYGIAALDTVYCYALRKKRFIRHSRVDGNPEPIETTTFPLPWECKN